MIPSTRTHRHNQSGSVIIWIFISIALFAALSFSVAQMMRGGGDGRIEELVKVHSSEIIAYGDAIRRGLHNMRISGVSPAELSFANPLVPGYDNPACGARPECAVFNKQGGGISPVRPNPEWLVSTHSGEHYYNEWRIAPDSCVPHVGTGDENCANSPSHSDLTLFLSWIKKPICLEINKQLGIANNGDEPPTLTSCPWNSASQNRYTGSFLNSGTISAGNSFHGRQAGCFRMGSCGSYPPASYHYYQVLLAR